jgi:hypothetical protein
MDLIWKSVAAFLVGLAVFAGLQYAGLLSVQRYLHSDAARASAPRFEPAFTTKGVQTLSGPIFPQTAPIDTSAGQRAAIQSRTHQIYLQHRAAQNAVPRPPRVPGMPRY